MTIKGKFKVDVYSCIVYITVADNILRSINHYHRKFNYTPLDQEVDAYICSAEDQTAYYHMFFDKATISINSVNHEKSHLAEHILQDREIVPKGEVRSYLDGLLSEQIMKFIKKRKIKLH